jgi:hypothetical protein
MVQARANSHDLPRATMRAREAGGQPQRLTYQAGPLSSNFGQPTCSRPTSSSAAALERSCSAVVAPDRTMGRKGWRMTHASATASTVEPTCAQQVHLTFACFWLTAILLSVDRFRYRAHARRHACGPHRARQVGGPNLCSSTPQRLELWRKRGVRVPLRQPTVGQALLYDDAQASRVRLCQRRACARAWHAVSAAEMARGCFKMMQDDTR